jgi:hypothetical protein
MSSPTEQRDHVARLAAKDSTAALGRAREIGDPWFRCQALSAVALHTSPPRLRETIVEEALSAGASLDEPDREVTVSSWPLKVLTTLGEIPRARKEVGRLLGVIQREPSPVKRADAVLCLFGAVATGPRELVLPVVSALAAASRQPLANGRHNRKGQMLLARCLTAIDRIDQALAKELMDGLPASRAGTVRADIARSRALSLKQLVPWPNL